MILLAPDWIAEPEGTTVLNSESPTFAQLLAQSEPFALTGTEFLGPSAVGLDPERYPVAAGPLVVVALGADPPATSLCGRLQVLSTDGNTLFGLEGDLPPEHARMLANAAAKLQTKRLTLVWGSSREHGWVLEGGTTDLRLYRPDESDELPLKSRLPEGDEETTLRMLIDDSVNLLSELEFNRVRVEEGLRPWNVLWPWAAGFRPSLPSLSLRWGFPVRVLTPSLAMSGLVKLVGWRATGATEFGSGTATRLDWIRHQAKSSSTAILTLPTFREFRRRNQLEEAEWFSHEVEQRLLQPWLDEGAQITLLAGPFGLRPRSELVQRELPFDERLREEASLPTRRVHEAVEHALATPDSLESSLPR